MFPNATRARRIQGQADIVIDIDKRSVPMLLARKRQVKADFEGRGRSKFCCRRMKTVMAPNQASKGRKMLVPRPPGISPSIFDQWI